MPTKKEVKTTTYSLFLNKLASSGISCEEAERLGITLAVDPDPALPDLADVPRLRLAYRTPVGRETGFYRVRLLAQPPTFAAQQRREVRYLQPPRTGCRAYFPSCVDWAALLQDTSRALLITEGELKAACATLRGYPTIGLGGVYSWRSAERGEAFLPELVEIAWKGRNVFIVFDSDAATKHQVQQAMRHLAATLTGYGAQPFIAKLPTMPGLEKTGLDDFLLVRGKDALQRVLDEAEPYAGALALWELNDEVCFVRDPGFVVELRTGLRMSATAFAREVYAPRSYVERVETAAGTKIVRKRTAEEWLRWPHRREAPRITYAPGESLFTDDGELNTWRGSGVAPAPGDVAPWRQLLDHLFHGDQAARDWFVRWCAYPLAHPGTKLLTAVVLWGVHQGTGKSLLGYTLAKLYGDHNVSEITQDHLRAHFNDWLVDKQLVLGEEITGSDRRADADRLKQLITQKMLRVNVKHVREYQVPAVANFMFTSNHPDAFFLEDTDRRFFIHEVTLPPLPMTFYDGYSTWYQSRRGQAALLHELLRTDLTGFDPAGPAPSSRAKDEMIEDNKSDLAAWVLRLKREPRAVLAECGLEPTVELLSTGQLLAMYDANQTKRVTANGLGRELKRAQVTRFVGVPVTARTGVRTTYALYAVQNAARWSGEKTVDLAREWERCFGPDRAP